MMDELEVSHARLLEGFKHLEKISKLVNGDVSKLTQSHGKIKESYLKVLATPIPLIVDVGDFATNCPFDKVCLIEQNKRLKAQIENGLVSYIQGEKNLNDFEHRKGECV